MRYLEWTVDADPHDSVYETYFTFMLRESEKEMQFVHDVHHMGLFSRDTWVELLSEAGFTAQAIPFVHSEIETGTMDVFVGIRPG